MFLFYFSLGGSNKAKRESLIARKFFFHSNVYPQRGKNITLTFSISYAEIKLWVIYTHCPVITHLLSLNKKKNHHQSYCSIHTSTFCFKWMQNESVITGFKTNLLKIWLLWSTLNISGLLRFPFLARPATYLLYHSYCRGGALIDVIASSQLEFPAYIKYFSCFNFGGYGPNQ